MESPHPCVTGQTGRVRLNNHSQHFRPHHVHLNPCKYCPVEWACAGYVQTCGLCVCCSSALARQTDGMALSLRWDLKDQRGWKGRGWEGGHCENSYHGDHDITRGLYALPQWEFCLCGGEGKQCSLDHRRRHFVKFKWQKCGVQSSWILRTIREMGLCVFFFWFSLFLSPPTLLHLSVVGGCCKGSVTSTQLKHSVVGRRWNFRSVHSHFWHYLWLVWLPAQWNQTVVIIVK